MDDGADGGEEASRAPLLVILILSTLSWSVLLAIAMALWATVAG